jgi:glycosyltransferase involved in cell wall biosynthesis
VRLAIVVSHPIQYYSPLFRELARHVDLHVFFGQWVSAEQQARAGFGQAFEWDVDLTDGFAWSRLRNVAPRPGPDHFFGSDTPDIGAELRDGGFDAVLVLGWYLKTFVQAAWAAKRLGLPVMARGDSHLGTPRGALVRWVKAVTYPGLLRAFDAALYVGVRSRAYYEHYGYPSDRLFFSPHCVDTAWFADRATAESGRALRTRLGVGGGETVVLFAGKLVDLKRPLDIIEAVARQGAPPVHVVVAGSGELAAAMTARAAALGVNLHLLGFLNQTQMPSAYAAANVLVLPSTRETWGLVANEALACGTPIILADTVGCAPDLAADGRVGRVFPVGDVAALAHAIGEVVRRPPSRGEIAAKSRAYGLAPAVAGIVDALAAVTQRRPRA